MSLDNHFSRAVKNIARYGDTDVFPFPIENSLFYDCEGQVVELLKLHEDFDNKLNTDPPFNENHLAPIGYSGFRWVTQIDPLWNAYLLGLVVSIGEQIESARIARERGCVFSYRFVGGFDDRLFDDESGWRAFHERSLSIATDKSTNTVVVCDIADFYHRVRHHRLDNALQQLPSVGGTPTRLIKLLSKFSETYSHGLPVGGPASRILSELLLNQIDRLLTYKGIRFCRFADDYHIFAASDADAFEALLFLSEKLILNEGLALQRSKTRIMSAAEFAHTSPIKAFEHDETQEDTPREFLALSLRFDPYSPNAAEEYELLRSEIEKYDIIGSLRTEIAKSRVDPSTTRHIVKSLKFIADSVRDHAALTLFDGIESLYPIFPTVMIVAKQLWPDLSPDVQGHIGRQTRSLFFSRSRLVKTEVNQAYAIRLLSCEKSAENIELLTTLFEKARSSTVRRDIVLAMFNWKNWTWISDLRSQFQNFSPPLRRAFIVASYSLGDEGKHWRKHNKNSFSSLERVLREWVSLRVNRDPSCGWQVPL